MYWLNQYLGVIKVPVSFFEPILNNPTRKQILIKIGREDLTSQIRDRIAMLFISVGNMIEIFFKDFGLHILYAHGEMYST